MKNVLRAFPRLLLPVCVVALSAGCQKSGTPAKAADAGAATPAGQTATAQPGAPAAGLPGTVAPALPWSNRRARRRAAHRPAC